MGLSSAWYKGSVILIWMLTESSLIDIEHEDHHLFLTEGK